MSVLETVEELSKVLGIESGEVEIIAGSVLLTPGQARRLLVLALVGRECSCTPRKKGS